MSADEKTINTFATRVRQLILEFGKLKQENAELYEMVDERDAQIRRCKRSCPRQSTITTA